MRLTKEELQECVRPLKVDKTTKPMQSLAFAWFGEEDALTNEFGQAVPDGGKAYPFLHDPNSKKALAKVDISSNGTRYFIKQNSSRQFFNPINSMGENNNRNKIRKLSPDRWDFREVGYKVFMHYLNFLKTHNVAWLKNCERETM